VTEQQATQDSRRRRPSDELRDIVESAAPGLAKASAEEVVEWAGKEFGLSMAVACSMADAVLPHLVSRFVPGVDVLFLETGYHFAETIGTRDAVAATLPVNVVDVLPILSVAEQDATHGKDLFTTDPTACCRMRKVEPLAEQLIGYEAWVTGVRREESPTRTSTPLIGWDHTHGLVKINPLAAWTFDELVNYAHEHNVLVNPLLEDGYPSIGCAPCTRRVEAGSDLRSGRWAGFSKVECGIHL
jgi:phosphoadenosine phosphosulfate reductase